MFKKYLLSFSMLIVWFATTVGSGTSQPKYEILSHYTPPTTVTGNTCIAICQNTMAICQNDCNRCNQLASINAQSKYTQAKISCIGKPKKEYDICMGLTGFLKPTPNDIHKECGGVCACKNQFDACYQNCGGRVIHTQKCVQNCDVQK